jgi:hypothetical protein
MTTATEDNTEQSHDFRTSLIFISFLLIFYFPVTSFAKEPPVLTLRSFGGGEEGLTPSYQFEIYKNGFVRYTGQLNVKIKGDKTAKITPKQVQQLIATYKAIDNLFKKQGWYDEENRYWWSRHNPYSFKLHYQGEVSEIAPGGFANDMFINLNKMIPVKDWVCTSKDDLGCPLTPLGLSIYPID